MPSSQHADTIEPDCRWPSRQSVDGVEQVCRWPSRQCADAIEQTFRCRRASIPMPSSQTADAIAALRRCRRCCMPIASEQFHRLPSINSTDCRRCNSLMSIEPACLEPVRGWPPSHHADAIEFTLKNFKVINSDVAVSTSGENLQRDKRMVELLGMSMGEGRIETTKG